jgi:hypothetical protein
VLYSYRTKSAAPQIVGRVSTRSQTLNENQCMGMLFHRTLPDRASTILCDGFRDSEYDAFDGCGDCRGVYLCTDPHEHDHEGPALLEVVLPDDIVQSAKSDPCASGEMTDYIIPSEIINARGEVRRVQ